MHTSHSPSESPTFSPRAVVVGPIFKEASMESGPCYGWGEPTRIGQRFRHATRKERVYGLVCPNHRAMANLGDRYS